jgi:5'(3')-deoxyribonucleotidase
MKRIAIDVDEVLTPFLPSLLKWRKPRKLPKKFPYLYREISEEEIHEFYESQEFMNLEPIKNSQKVLENLKEHKLFVVTGRQNVIREQTENWIEKWYPGIFEDVILRNLNIGLLIDDNFTNCVECISVGTKAINFVGDPVYPWCFESEISKKSWEEVWMSLKH